MLSLFFFFFLSLTTTTITVNGNGAVLFADEFNELDNEKWQHEITLGGGGNWEFEVNITQNINTAHNDTT